MLVSRVDIVTGGASAVYGSDAVTGVVNFVLDRKFDGLKIDANAGLSTYADAMSYNFGVAVGTDLFGGRGHFEAALEYRHRDPVNQSARPYGPASTYAAEVGTGTAADPFNSIPNGRRPNSSFGGVVQGCVPACPLAQGTQFAANGVLSPFYPGIAGATDANGNATAGTSNLNSGGDGAYSPYGQMFDGYHQATLFGRFSYDLANNVTFYVQGQGSEAYSFGWYFPQKIQPGAGQADLFYKNNPFLTPAVQAQLGNDGTNPLQTVVGGAAVQPSNTFQLGEFLTGTGPDRDQRHGQRQPRAERAGRVRRHPHEWPLQLECVLHPCARTAWRWIWSTTRTFSTCMRRRMRCCCPTAPLPATPQPRRQRRRQYANCVPINPFGPTAVSLECFQVHVPDDGLSIRPIPWMTWAAASRARCWMPGRVPSPRRFRRKCASTPMT